MAKFYVQSGSLRTIVHADSADRAALWAVHQVLGQVLPVFDDEELSAEEKQTVAAVQGVLSLDEQVALSERGFDRPDAMLLDTCELVSEWSQLVIALAKMEKLAAERALCMAV
jgi:hypothetical protein